MKHILAVLFISFTLCGCGMVVNEAAREELGKLQSDLAKVVEEGKAIKASVDGATVKMKALEEEYSKKLIDEQEYMARKVQIFQMSQEFFAGAERVTTHAITIQESIKQLITTHEVPGWQIGLTAAAGVLLQVLTGAKLAGAKNALGIATEGIGLLVKSIERGGPERLPVIQADDEIGKTDLAREVVKATVKGIKDQVKKVPNKSIEAAIRNL